MHTRDILFLCQFFYPEHNSSATLPFDTAVSLAGAGFSVDALAGYPKEYSDAGRVPLRETKDGVNIRRIRYLQPGRVSRLGRLINYFSFTASALLHLFRLRRYRCVITYSNPPILPIVPLLAERLFGTKLVFVAYDVYPEVAYASGSIRPGSLIDRVMGCINHSLYRRAACVVALTDEMRSFLLEHRPELAPDRVTTIANWAHEKTLVPTPKAWTRFGYEPGQFVVSYFGNMGTCQEMDTLVRAIEQLREDDRVRFLIIGHGNKKAAITERFRQAGLTNVQMLDFLTGEAFEQAVAVSSCCVVSLEQGLKGTCAPSKFYSYLQGGKPVLAVVERGSYLQTEVEEHAIGRAVELGDADGLVRAVLALQSDPQEARAMGRRARALYEREYALPAAMEKYRRVFNTL